MKKRVTAIIFCLILAVSTCSVTALADNNAPVPETTETTVTENEITEDVLSEDASDEIEPESESDADESAAEETPESEEETVRSETSNAAADALEKPTPTPVTWTPSGIDLRTRGIVTPVKRQNPWSTCWSFGAIAASEISILNMLNQTYEETGLNLSERHLIYFAQTPLSKENDETQAGEGIAVKGKENDPNAAFTTANPIITTTLLSSGVGPVDEESFPYRGKTGITEYQFMLQNKEQWINNLIAELVAEGYSEDNIDPEKVEAYYQRRLEDYKNSDAYSSTDDWSVPQEDRNLTLGYTLIDGNNLPSFSIRGGNNYWMGLNQEGIDAAKKELSEGRGVSIGFCADTASPDDKTSSTYINTDTWAHYTFDNSAPNHGVCIVGYDDNYPKENFTHNVYQKDIYGDVRTDANDMPILDEEKTALTTPEGNGAWIVKNSWGSETDYYVNEDGRPINKGAWGLVNEDGKHTGYFYISYYDKSVCLPESYRYAQDLDAERFDVYQYDYMAALEDFFVLGNTDRIAAANVYEIDEPEKMMSVGVRTSDTKQTMEFSIYKLNPDAKDPTDGAFLGKYSVQCDYAGFHRIALTEPIPFEKGDKISVISETTEKNDKGETVYKVSANKAPGINWVSNGRKYGTAVVNPGESYLLNEGVWKDWSEFLESSEFENIVGHTFKTNYEIDNFTLKAYFLPEDTPETIEEPSDHEAELVEPGEDSAGGSNGPKSPKTGKVPLTGDQTDTAGWFVFMAAGLCTAVAVIVVSRKRKQ